MQIQDIINQLRAFSSDIAHLNPPIKDDIYINIFESKIGFELPADYKKLIRLINGFDIMGAEVYGIHKDKALMSLESVFDIEHFQVAQPQPNYIVPFSPDGGGNFYCFDLRYKSSKHDSCPIIFWVSNFVYTDEDQPEVVYESFTDFVKEVIIGWTLEEYDYEGNKI